MGWWSALLCTLKCSCLPPGIDGDIFTLSRTQRVVWSPSPRGFPAVLALHPKAKQTAVGPASSAWGSAQLCRGCGGHGGPVKGASQPHRTLIWFLDWFFGMGEIQRHPCTTHWLGWWKSRRGRAGRDVLPLPREHSTCRALGKKAVPSCLCKQSLCISSVSHTAHPSVPTLPVLWEKPMLVLHFQEGMT